MSGRRTAGRVSLKNCWASPHAKAWPGAEQRCAHSETVIELVRSMRLRQPRLGVRKLHHLLKQPLQRVHASPGVRCAAGRPARGSRITYLPTDSRFVYLGLVTDA